MHGANVGKPQAKWASVEISIHKEILIQIYSSSLHGGKGLAFLFLMLRPHAHCPLSEMWIYVRAFKQN